MDYSRQVLVRTVHRLQVLENKKEKEEMNSESQREWDVEHNFEDGEVSKAF